MTAGRDELVRAYREALARYLGGDGDDVLAATAPLVMQARDLGCDGAELAMIHHDAAAAIDGVQRERAWRFHVATLTRREGSPVEPLPSRFLLGMAHDLRAPLNAIIGFSELLEQELAGPLTSDQREWVRFVLQGGRQLLGLIGDLLDLARIDAGRMELVQRWLHPKAVLDAALHNIEPLAERHEISISSRVEPALRDVRVDPLRLQQAIHHLLAGAIRSSIAGGEVTLRAATAADRLQISVGCDPEVAAGWLRSADTITSGGANAGGVALSLVLCRRLAELHGGSAGITRLDGHPAFRIVLPIPSRDELQT